MDMLIDKLQAVPVAGNDHTFPAIIRADPTNCANNIVRFPALTLVNGDIHGPEDIFHDGHLHGQFFRHAVAGGLVAIVFQVAEGGAMEVKGNADGVRILLFLHSFEDIQKAKNGMGIKPFTGCEGLYTEKGTIYDRITV